VAISQRLFCGDRSHAAQRCANTPIVDILVRFADDARLPSADDWIEVCKNAINDNDNVVPQNHSLGWTIMVDNNEMKIDIVPVKKQDPNDKIERYRLVSKEVMWEKGPLRSFIATRPVECCHVALAIRLILLFKMWNYARGRDKTYNVRIELAVHGNVPHATLAPQEIVPLQRVLAQPPARNAAVNVDKSSPTQKPLRSFHLEMMICFVVCLPTDDYGDWRGKRLCVAIAHMFNTLSRLTQTKFTHHGADMHQYLAEDRVRQQRVVGALERAVAAIETRQQTLTGCVNTCDHCEELLNCVN
jgi:hypothetical protein